MTVPFLGRLGNQVDLKVIVLWRMLFVFRRRPFRRNAVFVGLPPLQSGAAFPVSDCETDRPEWLRDACHALSLDMHLAVFVHCLDICLADGAMVAAEADFLENLLEHLSVSDDDARQATRILSVKNRY